MSNTCKFLPLHFSPSQECPLFSPGMFQLAVISGWGAIIQAAPYNVMTISYRNVQALITGFRQVRNKRKKTAFSNKYTAAAADLRLRLHLKYLLIFCCKIEESQVKS